MPTIVLTGGGTAGHVTPALALLPELRKTFDRIVFVGGNGIEKRLAEAHNLEFYELPVIKFDRSHLLKNAKIPLVLTKGINAAVKLFKNIQPDVVFSKGGYVALPSCFAAARLKIPLVIHESDFSLGLANKLSARFATSVITSFAETEGGKFIGNPVRREILRGNKGRASEKYRLNPSKPTLLVFGGSTGAEALNNVVYKGLNKFTETYNLLHISGKSGDLSKKSSDYHQFEYSDDIADLYAISDFVVCRAGSNTLSELACLGKRCIVVPLPKGNSRGDQLDNAVSYKKRGFVEILPQDELFVETLLAKLEEIKGKKVPILDVSEINSRIVEEIRSAAKL